MDKRYTNYLKDIKKLSDAEWSDIGPFEARRCSDCSHLIGYVSWWCTNSEAKECRGTSIPGICKCDFYSPDWGRIHEEIGVRESVFTIIKRIIRNLHARLRYK